MATVAARREQMANLNPNAYQALVGRLLEAEGRGFWIPAPEVSAELRRVYGEAESVIDDFGKSCRDRKSNRYSPERQAVCPDEYCCIQIQMAG